MTVFQKANLDVTNTETYFLSVQSNFPYLGSMGPKSVCKTNIRNLSCIICTSPAVLILNLAFQLVSILTERSEV